MKSPAAEIPILPSVSVLAARYDLWLCDIWGVMHNGETAFAAAGEACREFRGGGGTVVLISNSPRPCGGVERQLAQIGVTEEAWDGIVTSGDVTRGLLADHADKRLYHLGPERDRGVFEGLDLTFADASHAEVVICTGLFDDESETPEDYAETLARFAERQVLMICANPDLMVERGARLVYCAGALAAGFEALGGRVLYAGKPHPPIYERAFAIAAEVRGAPVAKARALAIGDGIRTDIAGAARAGIDALFVASGLHLAQAGTAGAVGSSAIAELFFAEPYRPVAAQTRLAW